MGTISNGHPDMLQEPYQRGNTIPRGDIIVQQKATGSGADGHLSRKMNFFN
jgi:hypothetical protein